MKSRAKTNQQECDKVFLALDSLNEINDYSKKIVDVSVGTPLSKNRKGKRSIEKLESLKAAKIEEFDRLLRESIDEALASLGEAVKNTVYLHLHNDFGIQKSEIPSKIFDFSDIIHKIFGLGATRLEIKFMKNLNSKVKIEINWPETPEPFSKWFVAEMSFTEYVTHMRKNFVDVERAAIEN
jgi:hypothetical protein